MQEDRPSWTARWVAAQRARLHGQRPVRGEAEAELRLYRAITMPLLRGRLATPAGMATRTRFVDEQLLRAVDRGVRQVALIGAGYDGRALRFSDTGARWIEVDHPATQADKRRRLAGTGARTDHITFVAIDLLDGDLDSELAAAGHDPAQATVWICEGLFPYLTTEAIRSLCRTLRSRSSPDSNLVCNVLVRDAPRPMARLVRGAVDGILGAIGERRLSEFGPGDAERFLAETGWTLEHHETTSPGRADGTYLMAIVAVPSG